MNNKCVVCGIEFESVKPAKTCSPKCRVTLSRSGVTHSEMLHVKDPGVTRDVTFEFYTLTKANGLGRKVNEKSSIRKAKYWYEVPLAAIPVIQKGNPEMPHYMNGRQYFLWWKNEFKTSPAEGIDKETGEITVEEVPEIHNPFPASDKPVTYVQAGDNSRHWGTN